MPTKPNTKPKTLPDTAMAAALAAAGATVDRHKTIFDVLYEMETEVKRGVLFNLVRSLNQIVIFNVFAHVKRLAADTRSKAKLKLVTNEVPTIDSDDPHGDEQRDALNNEVVRSSLGNNEPSNLDIAMKVHMIRDWAHDEVLATSFSDADLSYTNSLNFAIAAPPRTAATDEQLAAAAEMMSRRRIAQGRKPVITAEGIKAAQLADQTRSNDEMRECREQIIDTLAAFGGGATTVDEAEEAYFELPALKQKQLVEHVLRAITNSMTQAAKRFGRSGSFDVVGTCNLLDGSLAQVEDILAQFKNLRLRDLV